MSQQSDAAKAHIEHLLVDEYRGCFKSEGMECFPRPWKKEYQFAKPRRWAFDYAVPAILCANSGYLLNSLRHINHPRDVIEIDGGTFQNIRTGHSSGVGLRAWREKHNAAMSRGWRVWHYAPEEIIKAGRKSTTRKGVNHPAWADCVTLPDEPILTKLPWM